MSAPAPITVPGRVPADLATRAIGVLIDAVPIIVLSIVISIIEKIVFSIIPLGLVVIGLLMTVIMPLIVAASWLLRGYTGASPGKMVLKTKVVSKDGSESTLKQRLMRNVTLAGPTAIVAIPVLGWVLGPLVGLVVGVAEIFWIVTKGERIGDQIANTAVVKL